MEDSEADQRKFSLKTIYAMRIVKSRWKSLIIVMQLLYVYVQCNKQITVI